MEQIKLFGSSKYLTGEILHNKRLIQPFVASTELLKTVSVNFGTYRRKCFGLIRLEIVSASDECLKKYVLNIKDLKDNQNYDFLVNCRLNEGERYFLIISGINGRHGSSVTAKYGESESELLIIDGDTVNGTLYHSMIFENSIEEYKYIKKSSTGLVTVVIPCYNSSEFVENTFISLTEQTYNHIQVIVVDDGSVDQLNLKRLVDQYHFDGHYCEKNCGASAVRNYGARFADGEYIFFCDSDVTLNRNIFEIMINRLHEHPECSWVYCNYMLGNKIKRFWPFQIEKMYRANCSSTMSMIRRCHFPGFDESLKKLLDWDVFLTMMENGYCGYWQDECLFFAMDRPDGITRAGIKELDARSILKLKHERIVEVRR